jgi:hypothetical protein
MRVEDQKACETLFTESGGRFSSDDLAIRKYSSFCPP